MSFNKLVFIIIKKNYLSIGLYRDIGKNAVSKLLLANILLRFQIFNNSYKIMMYLFGNIIIDKDNPLWTKLFFRRFSGHNLR